jgi:hypothetical protein
MWAPAASMSTFETLFGLTGVVVLSSYLYLKHRQRMRRESKRGKPAEWTGKPIDVIQLKPTLEKLRRDYLAARQPSIGVPFHRSLLGLARRTVVRLAYFQDRESNEQAHAHGR